jgi:hypothetical protein
MGSMCFVVDGEIEVAYNTWIKETPLVFMRLNDDIVSNSNSN